MLLWNCRVQDMWLFYGLLNYRKNNYIQRVWGEAARCSKTPWTCFPSFSSSLPSLTLQSGFCPHHRLTSPPTPRPWLAWNYFCQRCKLIAAKLKDTFYPCLIWSPSTAFDSLANAFLSGYTQSWLPWHHSSWMSSITWSPPPSPSKYFFLFDPLTVATEGAIIGPPPPHSFLYIHYFPGDFIHFNDFKCFLLAKGLPHL